MTRIERVVLRLIDLPLRVPFRISGGTMRSRKSLVVELHAGGAVGYGESAPFEFPFYSSETIGSALALARDLLIDRIEGAEFDSIEAFDSALRAGVRGNPFARCGFENAFWDLTARLRGATLTELVAEEMARLGVPEPHRVSRGFVESGVAVGIPEDERVETLARWIEEYRAEGYRRVKIKIRPGWDLAPCEAARRVLGPDFLLWADANAAYDLARQADARALRELDRFRMAFLEQPLHHDDILDHAQLQSRIDTPVCLDESLKDSRVARQVVRIGGPDIWNVKVQRMGGLLEAIRVYAVAVESGARLWGGTMPESGIGAQPILALAAFPAFAYPADVEPSGRWYDPGRDPVEIAMDSAGRIAVPSARGVAEIMDMDRYARTARVLDLR